MSIDQIFADEIGFEKPLLEELMKSAREGHICIPCEKAPLEHPWIHYQNGRLYLLRNWLYEENVAKNIKRLSQTLPATTYSHDLLSDEQDLAVSTSLSHTLSIITGGPGTGKTFTAQHIINSCTGRIILAAPTGKAAARLKEKNPSLPAKTLHALLDLFGTKTSPINADLIIVDECSMMDAKMMARLLSAVPTGCRLVLMGDPDQLPSIEGGSFFNDMIDLVSTSHLTKCFRSDSAQVLALADAVKRGDEEFVASQITPWDESYADNAIILSCIREGPFGVNTLNQKFAKLHLSHRPIIITKNDPDLELYNGDLGILYNNQATFSNRTFNTCDLPPYEYAFCLSVHKSQGSEFDHVVIIAPFGSDIFGKEILYTAITRAKKSVKLCGDTPTILQALRTSSKKRSGLRLTFEMEKTG
jgi:exodeoxyribonuclease V alpha subunit